MSAQFQMFRGLAASAVVATSTDSRKTKERKKVAEYVFEFNVISSKSRSKSDWVRSGFVGIRTYVRTYAHLSGEREKKIEQDPSSLSSESKVKTTVKEAKKDLCLSLSLSLSRARASTVKHQLVVRQIY